MTVQFHLAQTHVFLPKDETVFVVEPPAGRIHLQRLSQAAKTELQAVSCPAALVWDDLVYVPSRRGQVRPCKLQWPWSDPWLTPSVSHQGRCAIRADLLYQLHQAGHLEYPHATSQALAKLTATGASIQALSTPLRFTGWQTHRAYRPLIKLQPDASALSISIVINYRDRPDLMALCLKSIQQQRVTARLEVILIDNQSQPHNREDIERQVATFLPSPVSVQHLQYNAPFNHSVQTNLGVDHATGDVLVMLNNDARFIAPDALQTLADWALTPNVASVGPRVLGRQQRLVASGIQVYSGTSKKPAGIRESAVIPLCETIRGAAGNSFACAAMTRDAWYTLGGLKPDRFPTQYNDADYCLRALEKGFRHIYLGSLTIYHEPGQSESRTRASTDSLHEKLRNYHPLLDQYTRLAPELVPIKSSPPDLVLNNSLFFKALEKYRRFKKKI